jgi:thiamine biosynthesis protein ThiS
MAHLAVGSAGLEITVNGDRRAVPASSTVASLLDSLAIDARLVVVERNREILRDRESFHRVELAEGDSIEIVHFVGGG